MGIIGQELTGHLAKESELLKVQIKKEDVQLIVSQLADTNPSYIH